MNAPTATKENCVVKKQVPSSLACIKIEKT